MQKKIYGIAIVGTGAIADIHALAIEEIENAKLVGVYNRSADKGKNFAEKYGCLYYSSLEELVSAEEVDIVSICTPSGMHLEPALESIKNNKHCLIEKPVEITLERVDQIVEQAKQNNVKVAVVYPSRFYPASQRIKQAIERESLGNIALASAYVKWSRTEQYYGSAVWRGTWAFDGGGALMNQAIHSVDLLQWFLGDVETVHAFMTNAKHKGIEVEDTLVATLKFKNGTIGTIECSIAVYPGFLRKIEVLGTEGSVILEDNEIETWKIKNESDSSLENEKKQSSGGGASDPLSISYLGHQLQIENLIAAIEGKEELLIDGEEGRKSVEIVEAIYKSARENKIVSLK